MIYTIRDVMRYGKDGREVRDGWLLLRKGEPVEWLPTKKQALEAARILNREYKRKMLAKID